MRLIQCGNTILLVMITWVLTQTQIQAQTLTAVTESWEGYTNKDGSGVYWEIVDTVFAEMGVDIKKRAVPWARAEQEVRAGKADIIVGAYYSNGDGIVFPKWHLSVEEDLIAVTLTNKVETWQSELKQKPPVWIRGYGFEQYFSPGQKFMEVNGADQGIKLVSVERGGAYIDYPSALASNNDAILKALPNFKSQYSMTKFKSGNKIYIGFSEISTQGRYLSRFDDVMDKLVKAGKIEAIYKKWHIETEKFGKDRYEGG